jgi:hypothetical protein
MEIDRQRTINELSAFMSKMATQPPSRRLRIFAFDPSLGTRLETSGINEITVDIQWENEDRFGPGPRGEYIEVIDADPASNAFYEPVDLNAPYLLAQDGLAPSESNPQFHQQMVYAVAMTTIRQFERALGRTALWANRRTRKPNGDVDEQFVRRLRIYPHALRDRNAYYSPSKKALLFGYFPVTTKDAYNTPGTLVFTCLSHDMHAFHEAFADIVALFQHFSYPVVLESQIRRTQGDLHSENLLGQLAQQFGRATGRGSALRDALGSEVKGVWQARKPDPHELDKTVGAHARGAILVAAVFRAFLLMYRARTADLYRIASQGTGKLPDGDIHPDLTKRLATEAAACADRILQMCIRAIDYCPPVNITFGDFLRAVVTADVDFSPQDKAGFRQVFIESFREWGIHPRDITNVGWDALIWPTGWELYEDIQKRNKDCFNHPTADLSTALKDLLRKLVEQWNLESERFKVWSDLGKVKEALWVWLRQEGDSYGRDYSRLFGLVVNEADAPRTVYRTAKGVAMEVHSVRPALRRTADGSARTDLVVEITQRRRGYFTRDKQEEMDKKGPALGPKDKGDFVYRAGCTILIDPRKGEIRRVIRTPGTIASNAELDRVRLFLNGESGIAGNAFDAGLARSLSEDHHAAHDEPFALLHQHEED